MGLVTRPIATLLFVAVLSAAFLTAACSSTQPPPTTGGNGVSAPTLTATTASTEAAGEATTVIAVLQIVSQPALDAVVEGFMETLQRAGYLEPGVRFLMQNAEGDQARASQLAEAIDESQVDLVFSVSEPASQAAVKALHDVPVVFAAVTDPVASGLVLQHLDPKTNVTGVSDMLPIRPQLELFQQLVPEAERIGLIYNPAEADSLALVRAERLTAADMGLTTVEATVRDSSEVLAAAESLVGEVQAISVLGDSTVVSALESVIKVCTDNRIPLLAGDSDSVQRGAVAAWTFDYKEHGRQAGRMALRILRGTEPSDLAVEQTENLALALNQEAAAAMGVTLTPGLRAQASQIY